MLRLFSFFFSLFHTLFFSSPLSANFLHITTLFFVQNITIESANAMDIIHLSSVRKVAKRVYKKAWKNKFKALKKEVNKLKQQICLLLIAYTCVDLL